MPEIFQYGFMIKAMLGAAMIGALAPSFGVFLMLRRLSLMADTLSHVALAGVAIGILTGAFPPFVALAATIAAAVSIEQLRARHLLPGDAALAVFLYTALAVAVVIISVAQGFNADLFGYLFGSVLTTTTSDLWLLLGLLIVVAGFVGLFYLELALTSFDPDLARVSGVRVGFVNIGLAVLTAATITLAMRIVGVLLVGAMIVVPVLISFRLSIGLRPTIALAALSGIAMGLIGVAIAFYADVAAGGAVVLTGIAALASAEVWSLARRRLQRR